MILEKRTYYVPDMKCKHCVASITEALKKAGVGMLSRKVNLEDKTVTVKTDVDVVKVLTDAGFPPVEKQ